MTIDVIFKKGFKVIEKNLVVKANKLNESRYRLSLQEQRIVLAMLSMIKKGDVAFKPYSFTIKEFADLVGVTGKNLYGRIKELTRDLIGRRLTINESTGDLQIGWVSSAKYYDGEGRVELRFDPLLKPYLLALKQEFTRYQLKNTIRLKSAYSVRIYELLKQYQSVGERYFDLDDLRLALGVPDDKLQLYGNFKARVLEKAKAELINTDIIFTYEPVKTGRRVAGLQFTIKENKEVVKKSYKKKKSDKKVIKETQVELELEQKRAKYTMGQLNDLKNAYPDFYKKLEKQAKKRLSKKELTGPGFKLKIQFKMGELLPGFLQKQKIKL